VLEREKYAGDELDELALGKEREGIARVISSSFVG